MDCPCEITLNQKLSCKLERWCKLSVCEKQNHAQRNCIKRDLPVLIFCLLSIGSAAILDERIAFESIDILFCEMLYYCEQCLNKYWSQNL